MNTKLIVATLVGTVVAFLLGWLVWGYLLMSYFSSHMVDYSGSGLIRVEADMMSRLWAIALANLVWSFLLAWIFQKWANITSAMQGFIWAAVIFFLITTGTSLLQWSQMNLMDWQTYAVYTLVSAAFWGVVGAVIAWMLGMGKKAA